MQRLFKVPIDKHCVTLSRRRLPMADEVSFIDRMLIRQPGTSKYVSCSDEAYLEYTRAPQRLG